ncbi:MAG: hypothetical protein RM022_001390 [Nostoc sp. EfeVER01]|uniref:VMAP-C domain-containing protein n=1 Tax=Nostoc sp. EfeVER01 TaxID=3075406 RepID=UPI002AD57359|nr:hypothetical protein [Nostoc sp. EfeVER01]MDZ7949324.1 hypothetical protein [Nostoc sp. EfeVER01]
MVIGGFLLKKLRIALQSAFRLSQFKRFLKEDIDINISEIPKGESDDDFFYNALENIMMLGLLEKFLIKVSQNQSQNQIIKEFCLIYDLANILNKINKFENIKFFYIQFLKVNNVDDIDFEEVANINEILEKLTNFPTIDNKPSKLVEFVCYLHNDVSQKLNIPQELVKQLFQVYNLTPHTGLSEREDIQSSERLQSYLLITVASEATGTKGKFSLQAELIVDYLHASQKRQPIYLDTNESVVKCADEQLSEKISKLVIKSETYLNNKIFFLTIELLLPRTCIGYPFDVDIKVYDENNELRSLGEKYAVIVRSYERNKDANAISKMQAIYKNRAQLCQNILDLDTLEELSQWRQVALSWDEEKRLGIKLLCCLPCSAHQTKENFFKAVNTGGLLLALWSRGEDFPNDSLQKAFNDILSCDWIQNFTLLYQEILQLRKKAHALEEKAPSHLGYHLGILCEEPQRIPSYLCSPPKLRIGK